MGFTLSGARPATLEPFYSHSIKGELEPSKHLENIFMPMFTALTPSHTVTLEHVENGHTSTFDLERLSSLVWSLIDPENVPADPTDMAEVMALMRSALAAPPHQSSPLDELILSTWGESAGLVPPTPVINYHAKVDVIPSARKLLSGQNTDNAHQFVVSLAYTFPTKTLGMWFLDEQVFAQFLTDLDAKLQPILTNLDPDVQKKFQEFGKLTLSDLTESVLLRANEQDDTDEYSFTRVLMRYTLAVLHDHDQHHQQNGTPLTMGIVPFSMSELVHPTSLVFVNVEKHAHSRAQLINREWDIIKKSIQFPAKAVSLKKLSKLTAVQRNIQKINSQAASARNKKNISRSKATLKLRKTSADPSLIVKDVLRAVVKMGKRKQSQNSIQTTVMSFSKPSRRDPNNPNKMGRLKKKKYLPDIHIWLDCSGSISEENYKATIQMLIRMAKKLNINIYFSSFADFVSQESLLKVKGHSLAHIWRQFETTPKVAGGTNFQAVWEYIMASPTRQQRLNLMITDFEFYPTSQRIAYPKNMYYAPILGMDTQYLNYWITQFVKRMQHIDPAIATKLFGVVE